jgi:hypothetical protein
MGFGLGAEKQIIAYFMYFFNALDIISVIFSREKLEIKFEPSKKLVLQFFFFFNRN